jgi:hypothetical protein
MSDIKGIFLNSGMQLIGDVRESGDSFDVTGALQIIIRHEPQMVKHRNPETGEIKEEMVNVPMTTFQHLTPFVDESATGVDIKVPKASAFLYKVASDIEKAYFETTGRIQIQTYGAGTLSQLGR